MMGAHSMMERPEPERRVAPPSATMTQTIAATASSHRPTARAFRRSVPVAAAEAAWASNGMDGNPIYKSDHIGCTVVVKIHRTIIAGKLDSVQDAIDDGKLLLGIGYESVAVPLNHRITVIPEGYRLQFTAVPAAEEEKP